MPTRPLARNMSLIMQDLEDEVLIYDLDVNKAYCLNQTARSVFDLCDGKRTVCDIGLELSRQLGSNFPDELIWVALDMLRQYNLLENADTLKPDWDGLSRRQVIKKMGSATMIMLPLISSVVAPQAALAASACLPGICIAAGQNICAGCAGQSFSTTAYPSKDGTCSGTATPAATVTCSPTGGGISTSVDVRRSLF